MRRWALMLVFVLSLLALGSPRAWAQASQLDNGPAPPPGADPPPAVTAPAVEPPPAAPATPAEPVWDPLRAAKNMEVGAYYLKTGNVDAAIDRFHEAASAQPGLAKPYLLLGKAYDKKKDPKNAVAAYQRYLQLFPTAPDRKDVLKEISRQNSRVPKTTQTTSR